MNDDYLNAMIEIFAAIDPIPLARPRLNTKTRQAYYPRRSQHFKKALAYISKAQMKDKPPLAGKLKVDIELCRNVKIDSKKFGDVDNHQKAIFDALNGIAFADDSQIIEVKCAKFKGKEPYIRIIIEEIID